MLYKKNTGGSLSGRVARTQRAYCCSQGLITGQGTTHTQTHTHTNKLKNTRGSNGYKLPIFGKKCEIIKSGSSVIPLKNLIIHHNQITKKSLPQWDIIESNQKKTFHIREK